MKKIGIMSMQRIINYGSFMQAYALKKIIEYIGYDVSFVDYKFEKSLIEQKSTSLIRKIMNNINIIYFFNKRNNINKMNNIYKVSLEKYLNVSEEKNYAYNSIDELVIGSDEVFNCLQGFPVGFSRELFGKNYESIPVISYAACFGNTTLDRIKQYKIENEITSMLKKFKKISVRDYNSFCVVKDLCNVSPVINLDPVLIYDFDKEIFDNVKINNYILIYAYINRLTKEEQHYIKKLAKQKKKKIVTIGGYQKIADCNLVVEPFEIFSYFKHADYVITDTFHGSIFSMKTHSKFCTIIRNGNVGNNNKLVDLLERLKQKDRTVYKLKDIGRLYDIDIDYKETDKIIKEEKDKSIKYLTDNLI